MKDIDKRSVYRSIRRYFNNPDKLADYICSLDKQIATDTKIMYMKTQKEDSINFRKIMIYMLKISGFGKKTIPKFLDNISYVTNKIKSGELTEEMLDKEIEKLGIELG